jgi:hypothetical protein
MTTEAQKTRHQLGLEIADEGRSEEFHRKGGWRRDITKQDHYMADFHKNRRLKLEREYRSRFHQRPSHYEEAVSI